MTGSFIQSHWPCRTLWPISMFSRILAIESVEAPSAHSTFELEPSSSMRPIRPSRRCQAPDRAERGVQVDDAAEVARVALAEIVLDLLVELVELAADRLELL